MEQIQPWWRKVKPQRMARRLSFEVGQDGSAQGYLGYRDHEAGPVITPPMILRVQLDDVRAAVHFVSIRYAFINWQTGFR